MDEQPQHGRLDAGGEQPRVVDVVLDEQRDDFVGALGLSAIATGVRLLPLSITVLLAAAGIP